MAILKAIQDFGNWFWGIPILILIGGGGLFLTIYLGFPQLRHKYIFPCSSNSIRHF